MSQQALLRSYLYVPGSEPRMIEKAMTTQADAVVLDLEDAVAPNRKDEARAHVAQALAAKHEKPLFVRVNALSSGLAMQDIEAIANTALTGIRLPKTESPDDVRLIGAKLDFLGSSASIQCIIESALGVEQAYAIARAHPRVIGIGLGEADLSADLGTSDEEGLLYARSRLVVASRAARLASPVQSVYTNIRDLEGLRRSTKRGKHLGFFGRSAIHPSQLTIINEVFTPTRKELDEAQALLSRLDQAVEQGTGAFALDDGRFVDRAVVEAARRVLALAQRYGHEAI